MKTVRTFENSIQIMVNLLSNLTPTLTLNAAYKAFGHVLAGIVDIFAFKCLVRGFIAYTRQKIYI